MGRSTARWVVASLVVGLATTTVGGIVVIDEIDIVKRGDVNNDGAVNVSDIVALNNYLYSGAEEPPCVNQADVDDNGLLDLSDSVYLSQFLYSGGVEPPAPGPRNGDCKRDTTAPNLSCDALCDY